MLFPPDIISEISSCAYWADRLVRADLMNGYVVTENDYTSNFTAALRREINSRGIQGLRATIRLLGPSHERQYGADGCVILSNSTDFKVGLFEAKWPRLSTNANSWDSIQRSSGISHFDSQIARQSQVIENAAVWEMFYVEHPYREQPEFLPDEVSGCVWHESAHAQSQARTDRTKPWSDAELVTLLTGRTLTIAEIIAEICRCHKGTALPLRRYETILSELHLPEQAVVISYSDPAQERA